MNKNEFLDYCKNQLHISFATIKRGKTDDKQKHRTEGLLQAAKLLRFIDQSSLDLLVEEEHHKVFGETVQQRKDRKKALSDLKENSPDDYFSIPAIERR